MTGLLALVVTATVVSGGQAAPVRACDYGCALALVEGGRFDAAIPVLDRLVADQPADPRIANLLGIALTSAGRREEGSQRFRQALARDPGFTPARKNLAINEFSAGRLPQAERHLRRVLEQTPDDPIAHAYLAEVAFAEGRCPAAVSHYRQAGPRALADSVWVRHHATCLLQAGDREAGVALLRGLPDDDAAGLFEAGLVLGRAGAHAEAATFFAAAGRAGHDPHLTAYNQVLMLVEGGDVASALAVGAARLRVGPQPAELHNLLARAYASAGRIQEAYDSLRTAARLEPDNEVHYLDLALLCLDHQNFDLGLEIVDIGLTRLPASAALRLQRGVALMMKGRIDDAAAEFQLARDLDRTAPAPYIALAMTWMQTGRTADAVHLLRARAAADPRHAALQHMLGVALMRSGVDPASPEALEAGRAFEAAVAIDPRLAGAHAELGKLLLKRDEVAQAVACLERAMALDADNASAAYALAQAYRRMGNVERTRALLAQVAALNARERGDDPDGDLRRMVVRIVRQGSTRASTP